MRRITRILALSVLAGLAAGCAGGSSGAAAGASGGTGASGGAGSGPAPAPRGPALGVTAGPSNPAAGFATAGAQHTALHARLVGTKVEDVLLRRVAVTDIGGGAAGDLASVTLLIDSNGNGAPDAGDQAFGAPATLDAGRRAVFQDATGARIGAAGIDVFAIYDIAAGAAVGAAYQAAIELDADVAADGATTARPARTQGAPVEGGLLKVTPAIPSGPATPALPSFAATITEVAIDARDLVSDPVSGLLLAARKKGGIVEIDPASGAIGGTIDPGGAPGRLAIAESGGLLYALLPGTGQVARIPLSKPSASRTFDVGAGKHGPLEVLDMAVSPADPEVLLVALADPALAMAHAGVAVFDRGVQVGVATAAFEGGDVIGFCAAGARAFGYDATSGKSGSWCMEVDQGGVSVVVARPTLLAAQPRELAFAGGLAYASTGERINPVKGTIVSRIAVGAGVTSVAHDAASGRSFFLESGRITAFDAASGAAIGEVTIAGMNGAPASLVRTGKRGLAFRTDGGQVFVVESRLVR